MKLLVCCFERLKLTLDLFNYFLHFLVAVFQGYFPARKYSRYTVCIHGLIIKRLKAIVFPLILLQSFLSHHLSTALSPFSLNLFFQISIQHIV